MNAGSGDCSRRRLLCGGALLAASVALSGKGLAAQSNPRNGTARINGLDVYYEIHGGPLGSAVVPMVLLGGGALTIENAFAPEFIARFARRRPVIAIEQQGHGHTGDRPDKPMTIDLMVEDTAGVLAHLGVRQADLLGHSLGGIVATGVAIHHPAVVKSVTTLGTPYQLDGFLPEIARMQRDPPWLRRRR